MSAITDYNDSCQQAQDAIEAGLYAAALQSLEKAMAAQLRIPDSEFDREKLTFPRESLKQMIDYCRKRAIETGQLSPTGNLNSMRFTEVEYRRG